MHHHWIYTAHVHAKMQAINTNKHQLLLSPLRQVKLQTAEMLTSILTKLYI